MQNLASTLSLIMSKGTVVLEEKQKRKTPPKKTKNKKQNWHNLCCLYHTKVFTNHLEISTIHMVESQINILIFWKNMIEMYRAHVY